MKKKTRTAVFYADRIDVITNFAVIKNAVIDRVHCIKLYGFNSTSGWSGGAMVLGKLLVPGRPTIWIIIGQGSTALAVGAGGGCFDIFTLLYLFFSLSPSLGDGLI